MNYPHVFRYGVPNADGNQRWMFQFGITVPGPTKRGRPRAQARVRVAQHTDSSGAESFFWSDVAAAVACDTWKFRLYTEYGIKLVYSCGGYDQFAEMYKTATGYDVQNPEQLVAAPQEWLIFRQHNADFLSSLSPVSVAWDPHKELYEARQLADRALSGGATLEEVGRAGQLLDWATDFKDLCKLKEDVDECGGLERLETEVKAFLDAVGGPVHWRLRNVLSALQDVVTFRKRLNDELESLKKSRP